MSKLISSDDENASTFRTNKDAIVTKWKCLVRVMLTAFSKESAVPDVITSLPAKISFQPAIKMCYGPRGEST